MLGAIVGDIIGSPYEFESDKTKDFELFIPACRPTDDSVLTVAVGLTCVEAGNADEETFKSILIHYLKTNTCLFTDAGYGKRFYQWAIFDEDEPYGGYTNGSAMRVSPIAWAFDSLETVEEIAKWSAEVTHDHPEGIRGAQAVAAAIFLARTGADKEEIRSYIESKYYDLNFTVDEIRPGYFHDMTCEGSVPQAIVCFLDAEDYEDAVRNAVSLGGDGDTLACMAGAIAEAYYGVPDELVDRAFEYMDTGLIQMYASYADELYAR